MTNDIQPYLDCIPKAVVEVTKALKTYAKLEAVLQQYASDVSGDVEQGEEERKDGLLKKLKPILTDAGVGKKGVLEMVDACLGVRVQPNASETNTSEVASSSKTTSAAPNGVSAGQTAPPTKEKDTIKTTKRLERTLKSTTTSRPTDAETTTAVLADLYIDNPDPKVRLITALSQESRFHLDCTDTSSLEIDLKNVTLTLAGRDLLSDAHLRLKSGVHYGLVGRNGSGKSTLLTAIGEKLIPGLPRGIKVLLVSQMTNVRAAEEDPAATVLQVVVRSDVERTRAVEEVERLSRVLENRSEDKVRDVVLDLELERKREGLKEARKLAVKWSGARGHGARKDLLTAEAEFDAAQSLVHSPPPIDPVDPSRWSALAGKMLVEAQALLSDVDASSTEARAQKILHGLGFTSARISSPFHNLSGGWKSRACLASALLQPAHLLLLDEPVNYLDLPAVLFVQSFIASIPHTVVTVSHDREFLNSTSTSLIHLHHSSLSYFDGNLEEYERESRQQRLFRQRQREALDKKRDKVQKSIESVAKAAKKSGDDGKLRMVKSRQKKLDDRWGVEVNSKGHRFKLNRDFGGYHLTSRGGVEAEAVEERVKFKFVDPEPLRFPGSLVHLEGVGVRYEGMERDTVRGVDLTIGPGERVGIVGPNGHGKTTLLNCIVGKLIPKGTVERHPRATIGIYAQHTLELLSSLNTTALAHFQEAFPETPEGQARSFLGQLGLKGRTADTIRLNGLSGGQLVRLGLAEVMWKSPDLVILDEVTTHLDSDTIDALIDALQAYTGAVLLVSHDRYAVKRLIQLAPDPAADDEDHEENTDQPDQISDTKSPPSQPGRTYLLQDGSLKLLPGGMDQYTNAVIGRLEQT